MEVPYLRSPTLLRPRLLAAFGAVGRAPLSLVVAPAGYGKTTLLAQYARSFDGPVGWLRVEPTDSTVDRLAARVAEALPRAQGTGRALIIDDLHLADRTAARTVLDRLLTDATPGLQVAVGSRRMPEVNLTRYELAETVIIDADQLRFRVWEVERLLRNVYGEPLPGDDVAALARRVGGWAAGLKLFHLSTRGRRLAERRQAVAALDGRSALSRAYLTTTVLTDLPAALHHFLLRTCVFDVLSAARCDLLLGTDDSQGKLEQLERQQAFTLSHDGGRTFTHHEVLRAHLLSDLVTDLGEAGARNWHARAAEIVAAEDAPVEAARCYARAGDWAQVRRLLDDAGTRVVDQGLDVWTDVLPSWFVAGDPWLVLAQARHRATNGQFEAAVTELRRAEELFSTESGRARCRSLRRLAGTWLPAAPATRSHWSEWLRAATRRHPAVVAAEAEGLNDPAAPLVSALAQLLAGDVTAARRIVDGRAADGLDVADLTIRLLQACFAAATGDPAAAAALAAVAADAERAHLPWLVRLTHAAAALDGTEAAAKEARALAEECARIGDTWGAVLADGLALLMQAAGTGPTPEAAAALLAQARGLDAGVLVAWAQALLALASTRARLPDAELEVRRAESTARAAGVPGAYVLALVAGAADAAARPDRLAAAFTAGAHAGLPDTVVAAWAGRSGTGVSGNTPDAPFALWCFGGFRLVIDGQLVDWSALRPRVRTLVRILAVNAGRPVHRDTLIGALWPEVSPAAATRSLHVGLSSLRSFLDSVTPDGGHRLLRRDGDAYLLAVPADGYADVAAFRAALAAARSSPLSFDGPRVRALRAAVQSYGGDLLPEDGAAEWIVGEREKLRRHAADAAADLAMAGLAADPATPQHANDAVAAAQRCVDIDPYHDTGWRLLINAHRLAGNVAAAEQARRSYAAVLASLGVDPEPVAPVLAGRRSTSAEDLHLPQRDGGLF